MYTEFEQSRNKIFGTNYKHILLFLCLETTYVHWIVQLQLPQHYWLGHRLGLLWYWMVCVGDEQRSFCHFWDCTQVPHFGPFVDYVIYSKGFLPTVVDIMVIWIKFAIPIHFSSLIPKMLMFTLAISCLTTSKLPWPVDLTLQVHMQYCSLQHQTLLSPPDISTTEHHFHFGPDASFFLELLVIALLSSK